MTCEKIKTANGFTGFICSRGSRKKKPEKPKPVKLTQIINLRHQHRADSTVHRSMITGKPEPIDDYVSVWGPSRFDPRFEACQICGKANPRFGRPPEPPEKADQPVQMSF